MPAAKWSAKEEISAKIILQTAMGMVKEDRNRRTWDLERKGGSSRSRRIKGNRASPIGVEGVCWRIWREDREMRWLECPSRSSTNCMGCSWEAKLPVVLVRKEHWKDRESPKVKDMVSVDENRGYEQLLRVCRN